MFEAFPKAAQRPTQQDPNQRQGRDSQDDLPYAIRYSELLYRVGQHSSILGHSNLWVNGRCGYRLGAGQMVDFRVVGDYSRRWGSGRWLERNLWLFGKFLR